MKTLSARGYFWQIQVRTLSVTKFVHSKRFLHLIILLTMFEPSLTSIKGKAQTITVGLCVAHICLLPLDQPKRSGGPQYSTPLEPYFLSVTLTQLRSTASLRQISTSFNSFCRLTTSVYTMTASAALLSGILWWLS